MSYNGSKENVNIAAFLAAPLKKGCQAREVINCAVAGTDCPGTTVVPNGSVVTIYCQTADVRVAFGEPTTALIGGPVPTGYATPFPIQRTAGDDGKIHVQCAVAGAQVIVFYQTA
jgi:hypothetical protein